MNKIKGDKYEIQIRDYIINNLNKPAYLWKDTPEIILKDSPGLNEKFFKLFI